MTMTSTENQAIRFIDGFVLRSVCRRTGPFITLYLPPHCPGILEPSAHASLKAMVQKITTDLRGRKDTGLAAELVGPLENLLNEDQKYDSPTGAVIFADPGAIQVLQLPNPAPPRAVLANHPYVTPVLPHIVPDHECYVLLVSKKGLRLGQWTSGACKEVALPSSVPQSLAEAGQFDQPDHNLEGRSTAGTSQGAISRVRFGTSADRERADSYLHNYFRLVDRELSPILGGASLVLIGVAEDIAAYRRSAQYPRLLEARNTGVGYLKWSEIGEMVQSALAKASNLEAENALMEVREGVRRDRVATEVGEILAAAHMGRVHHLILARDAECQGLLDLRYAPSVGRVAASQDLLNAAVVETIGTGGSVYVADPEKMRGVGPMVATLRY